MTDEIWKAIPGYDGLYEVSDLGRVRSLDRCVEQRNRWGTVSINRLKGRVLAQTKFPNGYRGVMLGRGSPSFLVHRLVAAAFLPNPNNLPEVNHKNLVRDDNGVGNLEWVTRRDNKLHSYESGARKKHGKTTPVVLTVAGVTLSFDSELAAAQHLGVSQGSVHSARTRNHVCCGYRVAAA